jgi:hypothetical protein
MTRRLSLCFFLACLPAFAAVAQDLPAKTWRRHTSVRDSEQQVLFVITEIVHVDPRHSETTVLIEDDTLHERFIYHRDFDLKKKRSLAEFGDDGGKKFIRRTYDVDLPVSENTIPTMLNEWHENPKILDLVAPVLTFEAPSFSVKITETELKDAKRKRAFVAQLRETLEPHFLESLELMRYGGLRVSNAAGPFFNDLGGDLFHGDCPQPQDAHEVEEPPDCGFDKAFGFPCSDAQVEKIAAAKRDGKPLRAY